MATINAIMSLSQVDLGSPPNNPTFSDVPFLPSGDLVVVSRAFVILEADFDEDEDVDGNDLAIWQSEFGMAPPADHADGDADFDQDVDGADFLRWQRQVGETSAITAATVVPEPSAGILVFLTTASLLTRGRSRFFPAPNYLTKESVLISDTIDDSVRMYQ
jgi:hypothetical protein